MNSKPSNAPLHPYNAKGNAVLACGFLGIMTVGLVLSVMAWRKTPEKPAPQTRTAFFQGETTAAINDHLEEGLPTREAFIQLANGVRYLALRGGGEEVKVGRDGWLYLTEEFQSTPGDTQRMQTRLDLLRDTRAALNAQGVELLVALVPDKSRVESNTLPAVFGHNPHMTRYADALAGLKQRQVPVVDLLGPLSRKLQPGQSTYYRTDTHWNPLGASAAAQTIAQQAHSIAACDAPQQYVTTVAGRDSERPGDLLRLMGLDKAPNALRPLPDRERAVSTQQASSNDLSGGSLFGDQTVTYVLTGTSFSLRGNFHGALEQALQCSVLNTAQDGGGFLEGTAKYLNDAAFAQSKPRVLIWELPERFLTLPLNKESTWFVDSGLKKP